MTTNWDGVTPNSFWHDSHRLLFNKDSRAMADLPDEYVQMVVTSPPYWGLRKYAGLPDLVWGGELGCRHQWVDVIKPASSGSLMPMPEVWGGSTTQTISATHQKQITNTCSLCGAWKGQLGLEPTPEMYISHLIEIFREVKRTLRSDGTCFINIGDSYFGGGNNRGNNSPISDKQASNFGAVGQCAEHSKNIGKHSILKPKDLCLIPFRLAIALQEDGWWVRSVIIWNKPNPMPESVTDRPTESHEYILMLTKSARYYWDAEAVREPNTEGTIKRGQNKQGTKANSKRLTDEVSDIWLQNINLSGRNLRSVWTFPTQPYPEAHFATYPEKLVEICVKAATPEVGCCSKCGAPWARIIKAQRTPDTPRKKDADNIDRNTKGERWITETITLGWKPQCSCNTDTIPSIVLDPFAGSGTTLKVAAELNRRAIGYELSQEYCNLAVERNKQAVLV